MSSRSKHKSVYPFETALFFFFFFFFLNTLVYPPSPSFLPFPSKQYSTASHGSHSFIDSPLLLFPLLSYSRAAIGSRHMCGLLVFSPPLFSFFNFLFLSIRSIGIEFLPSSFFLVQFEEDLPIESCARSLIGLCYWKLEESGLVREGHIR